MTGKKSIVKRLVVYFLLLNVITVGLISTYSYFRAKEALVDRTFDQLTSLRIEKAYRVERFFAELIEDLNVIAQSPVIADILQQSSVNLQLDLEADSLTREQFFELLQTHHSTGIVYRHFYLVGDQDQMIIFNGTESTWNETIVDSTELIPIKNLWQQVSEKGSLFIEDYNPQISIGAPAIYIGTPVKDSQNQITGMLAIEMDMEAINQIMFEENQMNGLGESGESYLVGPDHLMRSTSRFQDNSVFNTLVNTPGVEKALSGKTGRLIMQDYRGIQVLSSYSAIEIESIRWAILAEIDEKEAMIPIVSIRNNILYLSVLISLLAFALVYLIAKRISMPILNLSQAARDIAAGNYDVMVDHQTRQDELGNLVNLFNEMSSQIKEQTENLKLERSMRLTSMIDGQELERLRLSRELHDGLGQSILAIKMRLDRATKLPPDKAREVLLETNGLFTNVINEVRNISTNLVPPALEEFGLVDALKHLCREIEESSEVKVVFNHQGFHQEPGGRINTYLYRISQEALNNTVKHAAAKSAELCLTSDQEEIFLIISDDGRGFHHDPDKKICGNGLANIHERVQLLQGKIEIKSSELAGTEIRITIPT